jgi:hypothetical protein
MPRIPCYMADEPSIDVVWHEDKQSQLVESIFKNYTVPQVVFAVRRDEDGESRICVDGKQVCLFIEKLRNMYLKVRTYSV